MSDMQQGQANSNTGAAGSVPRVAPKPVIRLDKSKPFSEVHGERTQDDPHYKVHFMQGRMVGKKRVLLPFDSQGLLVEDDGNTRPYQAMNVDSKPVTHQPLYNDDMRDLVDAMRKKMSSTVRQSEAEAAVDDDESLIGGNEQIGGDDVNFVSWLCGEVRYRPDQLRAAAKARYHRQYHEIPQLVVDLVLDEKVVAEDEVCEDLKKFLPPKQN